MTAVAAATPVPKTRRGRTPTGAGWLIIPPGVLLVLGTIENPLADELVTRALWTTLWMSVVVTLVTWLLSVVFSLSVAMSPKWLSNTLFAILFTTLWISLLARTYGWVLALQPNGVLDQVGRSLGITQDGFGLFQTMPGLLVAMVHIMMPYIVLPVYSSMRAIDPAQIRAARSLGGSEWLVLRRLIVPGLKSGSWAGILLVFIMSLGFFVTPAFLGGPGSQVIATIIGLQFSRLSNIGLTAAIGAMLLLAVLVLYLIADRLFKISQQWERN